MNDTEITANIERADGARRRLVDDVRRMSTMTEALVGDGSRDLRRAFPALLGIAALAVAAGGVAYLIGRAGRNRRGSWLGPPRHSPLGDITRTVALNVIGVLAARSARSVPLAILAATSD